MGLKSWTRGNKSEEIAASYLKENGYTICQRNYRAVGGEIDIIAKKDGVIYFVEVKAREEGKARAAESISYDKKRRLKRAAEYWLGHYGNQNTEAGWLIVLIALNKSGEAIDIDILSDTL